MDARTYELVEVNVARLREPLNAPLLADFVAALEPINALADAAPGFVWRLQTEAGDATDVRVLDDDMLIVNMSTWVSLEALAEFVYRSAHAGVMRRRRTWFHQLRNAYLALWWVPAGHRPTIAEAEQRLLHLRQHGPTPFAFSMRDLFPPPGSLVAPPVREADVCPA